MRPSIPVRQRSAARAIRARGSHGDIQALAGSPLHQQSPGHRRALPQSGRARARPLCRREIADPGARSHAALAADAPRASRAAHARLRAPRHDVVVCRARREDRRSDRPVSSPPSRGRVWQIPRRHRRCRADRPGGALGPRQLRHAQDAAHSPLAGAASALSRALHADGRLLVEPSRTLVRALDPAASSPWRSSQHPRAGAAIKEYVAIANKKPKAFVWTKSAEDILASVERFCDTLLTRETRTGSARDMRAWWPRPWAPGSDISACGPGSSRTGGSRSGPASLPARVR
jgi:hypothetical protein